VGFVPSIAVPINNLGPFSTAQKARSAQNLRISDKTGTAKLVPSVVGGDENRRIVPGAGLRGIVLAGKRLSAANGKMVLCSVKDRVREVFEIAGFSSIFSIYGSHDDATRGLQA
jgi:STAS domain